MHDEDELPSSLTPLLMVRRMVVIDVDQGLLLVSLSHMKRNAIVNASTRAQHVEDWETIIWANFTRRIEGATLPRHFHQPTFTIYNGWIDPMEHVSHFNQRMVVHSKDKTLMCKVFPSSLGPVAMRWFDGLSACSIDSFKEFTWAFDSRFITCTKVLRPIDCLLS